MPGGYTIIGGAGLAGGGAGTPGTPGTPGTNFIYSATPGAPSNSVGNNGDTYMDGTPKVYSPKANGVWPAGVAFGGGSITNFGALGANDSTSRGTFYFIEDFLKNVALPEVTIQTFGTSNTVAPLGVVTTSPNLSTAEFAQHPGMYVITSVNKNGGATGCSNMALGEGSVYAVASGTITYQWSITFKSPAVLSNPTDQYVLAVGTSRTSSSDALNTGMGIRYCDDTNSGMWTLYTVDPQGGYYPINTSTTFQAATWYTLTITASGYAGNGSALFSFNLNGTSLGTYSAANWGTSTLWPLSQGGVSLARKAAGGTPAVITSYLDRCAVYITGLGR